MDDRVLRTPFFLPKFEKFYREIIVPDPDSIIKEADYQLLLARSSPEMYKFLLNWLTDEYLNPKYMGQDAVFVHLFEKVPQQRAHKLAQRKANGNDQQACLHVNGQFDRSKSCGS
jgi:hypothetical protein